jgi:HAE1 family hydrophobic/amphiphilic exporter-1
VPEIRKKNYQKTVRVKADINDFTLMTKLLAEVKQKIAKLTIPAGVEIEFGGDAKEEEEGKQKLLMIVLLSVFMVYAVMAIQFNSFLHPLIIMVSLPLAFIGSNFSLAIFGIRFSIMAGIGIVLLGGIVVNDAIVLVDYINQLRSKGRSKLYALQAAGTVRLRPIIMTSITTIFGVIPMALGLGHGSEIYVPLGVSLIGGLGFATVLTLVAIPLIYNMSEVAGVWLRGLFSGVVLRRK